MTPPRTPSARSLGALFLLVLAVVAGWYIGRRTGGDGGPGAAPSSSPVAQAPYTDVAGRVVKIFPEEGMITIDHEEIKGFMAAMVMDLSVVDRRELAGLQPGQDVRFDLIKLDGQYKVVRLRPADAPRNPVPETHPNPLERGDQVPDLTLIDAQGERFRLRAIPAHHKVVTFFYARCPLQEFCPAQAKRMSRWQEWIKEGSPDTRLISLTLDAEHDGPGILAGFADRYGADPTRWIFAGGEDPSAIREFADRAGGRIQRRPGDFQIDHALVALRVDGDRIVDIAYGLDAMERMVRGLQNVSDAEADRDASQP